MNTLHLLEELANHAHHDVSIRHLLNDKQNELCGDLLAQNISGNYVSDTCMVTEN